MDCGRYLKLYKKEYIMELVKFIFSDFWIFVGTTILISTIGSAISEVIKQIRRK